MISRLLQGAGSYEPRIPVDYGLGPSIILAGNENLGYFGQVAPIEVIQSNDLATLVGYGQGTAIPDADPQWLKFIDNGKILYVAKRPLRYNVNVEGMQAVGIRTGKIVTIKGRQFKVRLLTGGNADPATASGGEWDRLIYPVCTTRPVGTPVLAAIPPGELGITTSANSGGATFCQDKWASNGYYIIRGYTGLTFVAGGNNIGSNGGLFGWRPVLELVL
jgi:hypothetical protein